VRLNILSHVQDRSLGGNADDLRKRVSGSGLNENGSSRSKRQGNEQLDPVFAEDVVNQVLRARGQYKTGEPIDEHERQSNRKGPAVLPDELACFSPGSAIVDFPGFVARHRDQI
jgi:hypothetical protein